MCAEILYDPADKTGQNYQKGPPVPLPDRRGFEGILLGVCSSVDVTQSEGDLPDFNQSEH